MGLLAGARLGTVAVFSTSTMGCSRAAQFSGVYIELLDVEKGHAMEEDPESLGGHIGQQAHELTGLDGAGTRGWNDLHGSPSAVRRS